MVKHLAVIPFAAVAPCSGPGPGDRGQGGVSGTYQSSNASYGVGGNVDIRSPVLHALRARLRR